MRSKQTFEKVFGKMFFCQQSLKYVKKNVLLINLWLEYLWLLKCLFLGGRGETCRLQSRNINSKNSLTGITKGFNHNIQNINLKNAWVSKLGIDTISLYSVSIKFLPVGASLIPFFTHKYCCNNQTSSDVKYSQTLFRVW